MKTLSELTPGEQATIQRIRGERALRRRLLDMGLCRGTVVSVTRIAPLGDPIDVRVRGTELSLRKADAAVVDVN
jgi:ferrous iron transport protein A